MHQHPPVVGEQDRRLRLEQDLQVPRRGIGDVGHAAPEGEAAGHHVKDRRAALALLRGLGLFAHPEGHVADEQSRDQEHGEGDQVTNIGNGEGVERRNETEVERQHAGDAGRQRRPARQPAGNQQHPQQVEHRLIGQVQERSPRQADERRDENGRQRPSILPQRNRLGRSDGSGRWARLFLSGSHQDVYRPGAPDETVHHGALEEIAPPAVGRLADHDSADVALPSGPDDGRRGLLGREGDALRPELLREREVLVHPLAVLEGEPVEIGSFDGERDPRGVQARGHAVRRADDIGRLRGRSDGDEDPLARGPGLGDPLLALPRGHLLLDAVGGALQRQLAQRDEIPLAEEVVDRALTSAGR